MRKELEQYWRDIPCDKAHALTYKDLEIMWGVTERQVRNIMERLSCVDNGDNYILIRSSKGGGFYLTDDPDVIAGYKRECYGRAMSVLKPLRKINRVLRTENAASLNYSFTNNIRLMRLERGYTQQQVCVYMHELGRGIDESTLSKMENGYILPTPAHLSAMAVIFNCEPFELVDMQEYQEEIKSGLSSLQVS